MALISQTSRVIGSSGTYKSIYNAVSAVGVGSTVLLNTYTVPSGMSSNILTIVGSGTNIASYEVKVNGVTQAIQRTAYNGSGLDTTFYFSGPGYGLNSADLLQIFVTNNNPSSAGNFEGRIEIMEGV